MKPAGSGDTRPVLVTGGAGFIGCNLVDRLCRDGHSVVLYDSLARPGVEANLAWLRATHGDRLGVVIADLRDRARLEGCVADAAAVFHFAAQVAVTTSLVDPRADFEINVGGTINLLEALRCSNPDAPLVFASTNKVYGDLAAVALSHVGATYQPQDDTVRAHGIGEDIGLTFHTPYGCSKGAADQYVLDYAGSFGLRSAVLRMSCIYGPHQLGTEDQGWVAHFIRSALSGRPISIYGDGHQVRDVLHVADAVDAYLACWAAIDRVAGQAFNLGGGPANAVSLTQVLAHLADVSGRRLDIRHDDWRQGDQRYFVSDRRRIDQALNLPAPRDWRTGVSDLYRWFKERDQPRTGLRSAVPAEAL